MKDANGREIQIGDLVQRKIPHQFEVVVGHDKDGVPIYNGVMDPSPSARVLSFSGASVVCSTIWRGQIPVFIAETLEVMGP